VPRHGGAAGRLQLDGGRLRRPPGHLDRPRRLLRPALPAPEPDARRRARLGPVLRVPVVDRRPPHPAAGAARRAPPVDRPGGLRHLRLPDRPPGLRHRAGPDLLPAGAPLRPVAAGAGPGPRDRPCRPPRRAGPHGRSTAAGGDDRDDPHHADPARAEPGHVAGPATPAARPARRRRTASRAAPADQLAWRPSGTSNTIVPATPFRRLTSAGTLWG